MALASNVQVASSLLLSLTIDMSRVAGTKQKLSKVSGGRMGNNHGNDVALVGILRGCGHSQGRKEPLC